MKHRQIVFLLSITTLVFAGNVRTVDKPMPSTPHGTGTIDHSMNRMDFPPSTNGSTKKSSSNYNDYKYIPIIHGLFYKADTSKNTGYWAPYPARWGNTFFCGLHCNPAILSWTDINVLLVPAFEAGLVPALRLFKGLGIRGECSIDFGKTKDFLTYFEEDNIEENKVVGITRTVPERFKFRQIKLLIEFWISYEGKRRENVYLFLGGGAAFERDILEGREYGIDGPEKGYFSHQITKSNSYRAPAFSTGTGFFCPSSNKYFSISPEIKYSVVVNPFTRNEQIVQDNAHFIHAVSIVIRVIL